MPLPLILGAAALLAASYGAKKGYDGHQKHSEADDIVKAALSRYKRKKSKFDKQEESTASALEELGTKELEIGKKFSEFKVLADGLLKQMSAVRPDKNEFNIPSHRLKKIETYSYTALGVLGTFAGAGAAGAAAGFAVYGGVMALGAASTGTAISSLAGVAATNATLAAIGGGSLAAGGLGMAGGTAILGGAVAAPVLAIAGWAYNSHGEEALKNARKADREANESVKKLGKAITHLTCVQEYTCRINNALTSIEEKFNEYFDILRNIDNAIHDAKCEGLDARDELSRFGDSIIRSVENGYALASILVNLITTPIFKVRAVDGKASDNQDPEMETDADGSMILNDVELEEALGKAISEAGEIEAA